MQVFQHSFASEQHLARYFAKIAVRALYDELALFPKPGLVSFIDNGAHYDMNGTLLFKSLFGLRHYFYKVALKSAQGTDVKNLVRLGIEAEETMNSITKQINTHRGAIFALGILCSSISKLSQKRPRFSLRELQTCIIDDWAYYLTNGHQIENTHGAWIKIVYAIEDAKYLAIQGYNSIFIIFEELVALGLNDKILFGLTAYQRLLLKIDDLNILHRTGIKGLLFARREVGSLNLTSNREDCIAQCLKVHHLFSQLNISPGGVADMISFMYFLRYVFAEKSS